MTDQIAYTLLENALDYLLLAGEQAQVPDSFPHSKGRMLKHAVANLSDGMELLFKARIELTDWQLLFAEPLDIDRSKFESGNFRSISMGQIFPILETNCGIKLTRSERRIIERLSYNRNKVRHFGIKVDREAVSSLIVRTYGFAIDFIRDHLSQLNNSSFDWMLMHLRETLGKYDAFVQARLQSLRPLTEDEVEVDGVSCPHCDQICLCSDADIVSCRFCHYSASIDETVVSLAYRSGMTNDEVASYEIVLDCPECEQMAFVETGGTNPTHACLSCGESGNYESCSNCGCFFLPEQFSDDPGEVSTMCDQCWKDAFAKD